MFREYERELDADLCFQSFEDEVNGLPGKYNLPYGALMVACVGGIAVGCGAFRMFEGKTCELKRFFVDPGHRRSGIAGEMLSALLTAARDSGYERVVLDTLERLRPALAFYAKHGFSQTIAYYDNPLEGVVYLAKELVIT